ncbi:MAG: GNAT family N-acetyltransferase [Candidatus Babeliales bacterium]|jgi:RimJ/RimL family protein N-acetyltransferase
MTNSQYSIRALTEQDFQTMFQWLQNPHVSWWWQVGTQWPKFVEKYRQHIECDYIFPFIMQVDGNAIGYIQYYYTSMVDISWVNEISDKPKSTVGIDIFIGNPEYFAKGYGTIFMKMFIEELWKQSEIKKIIVDPQPENLQAIHCFKKLGFTEIRKVTHPEGDEIFYMELDRPA